MYIVRLYQVLPKGWQITLKTGVVWLTWSIFACAAVDLENFRHGMPLIEINIAVDDGPLFHTPTVLDANTLRLKLYRFDFLCICCKLDSIICQQQTDQVEYIQGAPIKKSPRKNAVF